MNRKYPLTGIDLLESDTHKWYEAECCWNCEPEVLQKMQTNRYGKTRPIKLVRF